MATPAEVLAAQFPATKEEKRDALAEAAELLPRDLVPMDSPMATILNPVLYKHLLTVAAQFSKSQLVPQHFREKPADVFIALHMAHRMGCDPILVLQNLYTVHGTPGWKTQFVIAQANLARAFGSPIRWRVETNGEPLKFKRKVKNSRGEVSFVEAVAPNLTVTAYAADKETGEELSMSVTMQQAIEEGWAENPKYSTLGDLMLRYRSAALLVRLYAPQVMLGVPTIEEVEDVVVASPSLQAPDAPQGPAQSMDVAGLNQSIAAKQPAREAEEQEPAEMDEPPNHAEPALEANRSTGQTQGPAYTGESLLKMVSEAETMDELDLLRSLSGEHLKGAALGSITRAIKARVDEIQQQQDIKF